MLMRYQKEKTQRLRKSKRDFSIEDAELTHYGEMLGGDDGFERPIASDDSDSEDEAGDKIATDFNKEYNFGGFEKREEDDEQDEHEQ